MSIKISEMTDEEKQDIVVLALKILKNKCRKGNPFIEPERVKNYLRLKMTEYKNEVFGCIFLDTRYRIIENKELFFGTIDGASVFPRVVVQEAMNLNASAVIFYHNHPSGVAEASNTDKSITQRLQDALSLIDVRVLDHFIICDSECVSFAEHGIL
jgi:DNA repair protein RadC